MQNSVLNQNQLAYSQTKLITAPKKVGRAVPLALSYDDVLLKPRFSKVNSRSEVNTETLISPGIKLKIPLISINMDTVTGVEMAIK